MRPFVVPAFALLAAAAAVPLIASAGQEDPRAEAARIERRLERIEARVLSADADLRRMNDALGAELLAAMESHSPGVMDDAQRLAALRASSGDGGAATAAEARGLEARVDAARVAALRRPPLAARVDAFHRLLRERMIRSDPEARALLRRYGELHGISGAEP